MIGLVAVVAVVAVQLKEFLKMLFYTFNFRFSLQPLQQR